MTEPFAKRIERRDPGGSVVTPRDLVALGFIADAQPVTSGQVRRLLGLSEDMGGRRLAVLRDRGLVRVHVRAPHEPNWYTLTTAGARQVARIRGTDGDELWVPRGIERADLAHHGLAVDVYVAFRVATTWSHPAKMVRWAFEREIRKAAGAQGAGVLVPDAAGRFELDGTGVGGFGPRALVVEVDLGHENPSFLRRKAEGYLELARAGTPVLGTPSWSVACVIRCPQAQRRLHRLAVAVAESGASWQFLLADELDDRTILTPVWKTPVVDEVSSTVALATSSPFEGVGTEGRNRTDPQTARSARRDAGRSSGEFGAFSSEDAR